MATGRVDLTGGQELIRPDVPGPMMDFQNTNFVDGQHVRYDPAPWNPHFAINVSALNTFQALTALVAPKAGLTPGALRLLEAHIGRIGADAALMRDPNLAQRHLDYHTERLTVLGAALTREDRRIGTDTLRRALDRLDMSAGQLG